MMNVLFIGVGQPHYFALVLNKIHSLGKFHIVNVVPKAGSGHMGAGVMAAKPSSIKHETCALPDRSLPGARFHRIFWGLSFQVWKKKISLIVVTEDYLYGVLFNPLIQIKRLFGLRILLKSIPFRVPTRDQLHEAPGFKNRIKEKLKTFVFRSVDGHLNYVDDAYRIYGSYGVSPEKIFVTSNSPDTDLLLSIKDHLDISQEQEKNPYRIIHVGRLIPWKNVDQLILVFAEIKKAMPQGELWIVGDGPEKERLQNLVSQIGVRDVTFKGPIHDYQELGKALMSSQIYVLAGMGGLSINDAMSFGLPIICSVCDGTEKKLVKNGYNGFIFEEGNLEDLKQKILQILSDPNVAKKMGANSERIIREEVNIQAVVNSYSNAFEAQS